MGAGRNLEHTPAIAVFAVFVFFLIVSYAVEQLFHKLDHHFQHKKLHGLSVALGKVKEELMLMGFCSLVLIVFEQDILKLCVNMRHIRGIPSQMQDKCPCAFMYFRDFVEKPLFRRSRFLGDSDTDSSSSSSSSSCSGSSGSSSSV